MNELMQLTMIYLKAITDPSASDDDLIDALEALEAYMMATGNTPEQVEYWCGYVLELSEEEELFAELVADARLYLKRPKCVVNSHPPGVNQHPESGWFVRRSVRRPGISRAGFRPLGRPA